MFRSSKEADTLPDFAEQIKPLEMLQRFLIVLAMLFAADSDGPSLSVIALSLGFALTTVFVIQGAGDALQKFFVYPGDGATGTSIKRITHFKNYARSLLAYRMLVIFGLAASSRITLTKDGAPMWVSLALSIILWLFSSNARIAVERDILLLWLLGSTVAEIFLLFSMTSTYWSTNYGPAIGVSTLAMLLLCFNFGSFSLALGRDASAAAANGVGHSELGDPSMRGNGPSIGESASLLRGGA